MKIQIQLDKNSNVGSLVCSEPFLLVDNETLEIEFLGAENKVLLASLKNDKMQRQMLVYNGTLSIPKEFIFEGDLEIIVSRYNDALSRKWHCEPIKIIKSQEDVFEGYSLIQELRSEIAELKARINALEEASSNLETQTKQLWELHEI